MFLLLLKVPVESPADKQRTKERVHTCIVYVTDPHVEARSDTSKTQHFAQAHLKITRVVLTHPLSFKFIQA